MRVRDKVIWQIIRKPVHHHRETCQLSYSIIAWYSLWVPVNGDH